jgi:putative NADH-flavin reductase
MQIAIIGATGHAGSRIAEEAVRRGHVVTGLVRDTSRPAPEGVRLARVNALDYDELRGAISGQDAVIAAIADRGDNNSATIQDGARNLLNAAEGAEVRRVVWIGGAGSLLLPDGHPVMHSPDFPQQYKDEAEMQYGALEIFRANVGRRFQAQPDIPVDWLYISPALLLEDGQRTAHFRIGQNQLLMDDDGKSVISFQDLAVLALDEVENPLHHRTRISIAY